MSLESGSEGKASRVPLGRGCWHREAGGGLLTADSLRDWLGECIWSVSLIGPKWEARATIREASC